MHNISRRKGIYGEYEVVCPYCGYDSCTSDFIDGRQAIPFRCDLCGAFQVDPRDKNKLTKIERQTGWYLPRIR